MPQPRFLDNKEARKQAIADLGGVVKVAKACGVGRNAVSNWYDRGFPRAAYAVLAPKLRRLGYAFSDQAFLQHRPKKNGGKT
jgi:hypothetical protein